MFLYRRYEIGEGLYIGWSSATLAICGGSCLLCACRINTPNDKMWVSVNEMSDINSLYIVELTNNLLMATLLLCFRPYPYQPTSRGHVLSTAPTSHSVPSNYDRNAYVWEVIAKRKTRLGIKSIQWIDYMFNGKSLLFLMMYKTVQFQIENA